MRDDGQCSVLRFAPCRFWAETESFLLSPELLKVREDFHSQLNKP